ncbi:hypothetical protein [Larkinella arboricola]|nr:hypothetical protein [Larkinella arboricola]
MSIAYFDKMMLSYSYKKEFFSKADKNAYRFRIGNKDRIKGVHTVQKDPYGIIFTWTSYGNKTRTLDDLIKELQPYRSGDKFGIPLYKFSNNGKNYTFWVQQKLGYEACFVTISTVK